MDLVIVDLKLTLRTTNGIRMSDMTLISDILTTMTIFTQICRTHGFMGRVTW